MQAQLKYEASLLFFSTQKWADFVVEIEMWLYQSFQSYISSSSSGARSGTDIGDHASPNISVIRQLKKI